MSRIRSTGRLTLGYRADARPFSYADDSGMPAGYSVTRRDRLWLRTEAPVGRIHGLEQVGVWMELDSWEARRVLWRGNARPVSGTYASPLRRLARLVRSISGRT